MKLTIEIESRPHNSGLTKVAVEFSADTFVVNKTIVLRINICGENRHLRQVANHYAKPMAAQQLPTVCKK